MQKNVSCFLVQFSSRSRCLSTQEKFLKLQTKYFWSYKQLKLHCLGYFLFRVWLVVMSPTGRFSLTTFNFMQTLLACLHVDAVFMFTQGGYSTVEGTGPVVVTVKMAPSSGILGNPVQVKVQTVPTGNAIGEYGSD